MPFESTITFTLDVICPWTYLAYIRLTKALTQYQSSHPNAPANFTLRLAPYQLYPSHPTTGFDKYAWYRDEKYAGSEAKMEMYVQYMGALGDADGVRFDWQGVMANSLDALRVVLWVQGGRGVEAARRVLEELYVLYFTRRAHPSSCETLGVALRAAGLNDVEVGELVNGGGEVGRREVERGIAENRVDGVDSVPYVVFEGRRRDFTLVGAKDVAEYVKTLEAIAKEC